MSTAPSTAFGLRFARCTHSRTVSSERPSAGLTWIFAIASGSFSATSSISTPPCAESIPRYCLAARSRVKDA